MDRERILAKLDEIEQYLKELNEIIPSNFKEYNSSTETKRASERQEGLDKNAAKFEVDYDKENDNLFFYDKKRKSNYSIRYGECIAFDFSKKN